MDNSGDKEIDYFLKNLCQPLPDCNTFLKDHGIKLENTGNAELNKENPRTQDAHRDCSSLENVFNLDELQKKLFGDVTIEELEKGEDNYGVFGIQKDEVELLEKLSEAAGNDLPQHKLDSSFQHIKNSRSLSDQLNVHLPAWTPFSSYEEDSSHSEGIRVLNKTLDRLTSRSSENTSTNESSIQDEKVVGHTVNDIAKLLGNPYPRKKNRKCSIQQEETKHIDVEDLNENNGKEQSTTMGSQEARSNKVEGKPGKKNEHEQKFKKKNKKKKETEYVPKLIPIDWSDPRSDPEFYQELEELMKCDAFNMNTSKTPQPPELDNMAESVFKPTLPRDILKVLSATDEELADWEYSIKVEKGEVSQDEDDSELEEFENELRNIKQSEKFLQFQRESHQKKNQLPEVTGSIDVSGFLKVVMPPGVEDIVATRDDEGNIVSYEAVPRNEEEVIREFERLHLGLASDDEDEDAEDDPEDKMYEIDWEKVKIKSNKLLGGLQGTITESELIEKVNKIEEYIETIKNEEAATVDPTLEKHMKAVDSILDQFGFPNQREIKADSIEEFLETELQKYDFIFEEHKGKICPPGNLVSEVKPEDLDYNFITEEDSVIPEKQTIIRPPNLVINLPHNSDSEEEEEEELPKVETLQAEEVKKPTEAKRLLVENETPEPSAFKEEYGEDDVINFFLSQKYVDKIPRNNVKKHLIEKEELELDNKFKQEYFSRGGTAEGLGEMTVSEPNYNLETLESYSKKFLTFPYSSEVSSENVNFVRMRRHLAECAPEFTDELLCDLSKVDVSSLVKSPDSDSDADIIYKPNSFKTEELLEKKLSQAKKGDDYIPFPSADENEKSEDEAVAQSVHSETDVHEVLNRLRVKRKEKRKMRRESKTIENSSSSESEGETDEVKTINAQWLPFETKPVATEEGFIENMLHLREIIAPKYDEIKIPNKVKKWLKGKYEPSRDEIRQWKEYFQEKAAGRTFVLGKVKNSKSQQEEPEDDNSISGINHMLLFKKLLEEQNKEDKDENDLIPIADETNAKENKVKDNLKSKSLQQDEIDSSLPARKETNSKVDKSDEVSEIMKEKLNIDTNAKLKRDPEEGSSKKEETEAPHPPKIPVLRLRDVPRPLRKEEWAEEVNSNAKIELEGTPAMSYPFELDGFQKHAIQALENGYNVFVSAHTSAGKTVVAEYAIAMSKRNRSKAVYTSPVKALSNQKYADFKRIFGSVGLITGDIQLNENAECLIMTTEILRSMLYNTSEKIRDLEFVVFDEVHYINDPERGHVWEEVLILLPPQVQIVMLSATVPNTLEFANWVGRTKQRKVMVCATQHRPVPLQHYIYTGTGGPSPGDTYLVKDGDGPFLNIEYGKAEGAMKATQEKERKNRKKQMIKRAEEEKEWKRGGVIKPKPFSGHPSDSQEKRDQTLWISVVSFLQNKDWLPAVVFVFSRKKCDVFAERLKTIDLTTKSEKSFIHRFIKSQVEKLDDVDQDLPQIKVMQTQLLQGIGVHHSGILPIMKEIVEVLFQEGKVKLLFATETFAMGVNMPARTVLFHSIKKFDGTGTRLLYPAEYIQMAGRAGRRGKDSAGNVIILAKPSELIARHDLETLMFGNPSKLISKFRLSYRMILNTLTMSGMLTVQSMMASSYCENQGQLKKKFVEKDLIEAEQFERNLKKKVTADVNEIDVDYMTKFYTYAHAYINKWKELRLQMICHGRILKDLQPGRMLKICIGQYINRTALLLEIQPHKDPSIRYVYRVLILDQDIQYTRDITSVGMEMDQEQLEEWYRLVSLMESLPIEKDVLSGPNEYLELVLKPHEIIAVYKENLKLQKNQIQEYLIQHNNRPGFRNKISEAGDKIARQLWASIGKTTEINESHHGFENFELCLNVTEMWTLIEQVKSFPIRYNPLVLNSFKKVFRWKQAEEKVKTLRMCLSDENMILYPDFKNKKALLKEKEYIDDSDTVQIKGYMAARVGKYELVVCELLVENILVNMEPEEVAALLSFLVCRSNNSDHYPTSFKTLTPSLQEGIKKCQKIIKDVILLEKQFQIEDYEGSETSKLSFGLVPIMYAWVKQEPFKKIMEMEELKEFEFQEGLLVRWIQQLLETLKEVEAAARVMGDPGVPTKLQAAGQRIKRGIVFAPSLYTTML